MLMRMWRKRNPCTLLIGMSTSTATMEISMEVPQVIKKQNYHLIQESHFWVYVSKGNKVIISKRYLFSHVHSSIIHDSQGIETTCVYQQMNGQRRCGVGVYTMGHCSAMGRKEILPFATTQVKLEGIIPKLNKLDRERQILQAITCM